MSLMFQVVTVYAGQRIVSEAFPSKADARNHAEAIFADAPVEVVDERTGRLVGTMTDRGWYPTRGAVRRPVEVA